MATRLAHVLRPPLATIPLGNPPRPRLLRLAAAIGLLLLAALAAVGWQLHWLPHQARYLELTQQQARLPERLMAPAPPGLWRPAL